MDEWDIRIVKTLSGCTRDEAVEALKKNNSHIGLSVRYIGAVRKAKQEEEKANGTS